MSASQVSHKCQHCDFASHHKGSLTRHINSKHKSPAATAAPPPQPANDPPTCDNKDPVPPPLFEDEPFMTPSPFQLSSKTELKPLSTAAKWKEPLLSCIARFPATKVAKEVNESLSKREVTAETVVAEDVTALESLIDLLAIVMKGRIHNPNRREDVLIAFEIVHVLSMMLCASPCHLRNHKGVYEECVLLVMNKLNDLGIGFSFNSESTCQDANCC